MKFSKFIFNRNTTTVYDTLNFNQRSIKSIHWWVLQSVMLSNRWCCFNRQAVGWRCCRSTELFLPAVEAVPRCCQYLGRPLYWTILTLLEIFLRLWEFHLQSFQFIWTKANLPKQQNREKSIFLWNKHMLKALFLSKLMYNTQTDQNKFGPNLCQLLISFRDMWRLHFEADV